MQGFLDCVQNPGSVNTPDPPRFVQMAAPSCYFIWVTALHPLSLVCTHTVQPAFRVMENNEIIVTCNVHQWTPAWTPVEKLENSQSQMTPVPPFKCNRFFNSPRGSETSRAKWELCLVSFLNYFAPSLAANTFILLGLILFICTVQT